MRTKNHPWFHLCISFNPRYARCVTQTSCSRFTNLHIKYRYWYSCPHIIENKFPSNGNIKPAAWICWYHRQPHWRHPQCSGLLCLPTKSRCNMSRVQIWYYLINAKQTLFMNLKAISPVPPATSSSFVLGPGSICRYRSFCHYKEHTIFGQNSHQQ